MRGDWDRWEKKRTTGGLLQLDIANVRKSINFDRAVTGSVQWPSGAGIEIEVRPGSGLVLSYKWRGDDVPSYLVPITYTTPNYGGRRPWFRCPNQNCGRRVRILYGGRYFLCRHCHDLTYESAQVGRHDRPRVVIRNRLRRLRNQLGGRGGLFDALPDRPQGMSWRRYTAICLEYQELLRLDSQVGYLSLIAFASGCGMEDLSTASPNDIRNELRDVWKDHKLDWEDGIPAHVVWRHAEKMADWLEEEERERPETERPDRLTLGELATLAGVPFAFAKEAGREGLVTPDKGRTHRAKRYRPRLANWLGKLETLRSAGYDWDDIRDWTKRRWDPGHDHERKWPSGYEKRIAHGQAKEAD